MNKHILWACLAVLSFCAQATPIIFVDTQLEVTAIASGDGAPGVDSQSGPATETPLSASASSGSVDIATAGAIAGFGLLTTSADVSGGGGIASSVATAHLSAWFQNDGPVALHIDFTLLDAAGDTGDASTSLFVVLASGGVTLFQDFISGPRDFAYTPAPGTRSFLELTLSSQASAGVPLPGIGNASAFGLVTFAGTVPETSTWLLFALGLGVVAVRRVAARR